MAKFLLCRHKWNHEDVDNHGCRKCTLLRDVPRLTRPGIDLLPHKPLGRFLYVSPSSRYARIRSRAS